MLSFADYLTTWLVLDVEVEQFLLGCFLGKQSGGSKCYRAWGIDADGDGQMGMWAWLIKRAAVIESLWDWSCIINQHRLVVFSRVFPDRIWSTTWSEKASIIDVLFDCPLCWDTVLTFLMLWYRKDFTTTPYQKYQALHEELYRICVKVFVVVEWLCEDAKMSAAHLGTSWDKWLADDNDLRWQIIDFLLPVDGISPHASAFNLCHEKEKRVESPLFLRLCTNHDT